MRRNTHSRYPDAPPQDRRQPRRVACSRVRQAEGVMMSEDESSIERRRSVPSLRRILVVASTFPSDPSDPVPGFVRNQVIAMKRVAPSLEFTVLAPHDRYTRTRTHVEHEHYTERRFHYAWPHRWETLTGRGILPALRERPARYALVPALFLCEFAALLRRTLELRPDVIYAHWFTPQGVTACAVSMLTRTPFVFTTHAADVDVWNRVPLVGRPIVRWGTNRASAVTAVSRRSMAKLAAFLKDGVPPAGRSEIIPMGVELERSGGAGPNSLRDELAVGDGPVVLFLGRLAEKKGVSYLLRAAAQSAKMQGSTLVIAGDGPLKSDLEKLADELGLSATVRFIGYASGQRKENVIELADVIVLPSIVTDDGDAEGLPVVLMEGLAAGKLCIATDESGADDVLVDGTDGYIVPQKDVQELTRTLDRVLSLLPAQRHEVEQAARRTAGQFEWSIIARRHLDLFERCLDKTTER